MISNADLKKIELLVFDIDGTLTDGKFSFNPDGSWIKFFNVRDEHWLKLALRAGLKTALLTARNDEINRQFAEDVKISACICGAKSKISAFEELQQRFSLTPEQILYAGDDTVDLPVLKRCGVPVVPADAIPELDEASPWRTNAAAGCGVACEVIRRVLKAQNLLDPIMERYRQ